MSDWPDSKVRSTALWYIGQHITDPVAWRWTSVGEALQETSALFALQPGESPIVGFFHSLESWYALTTRRVLGAYAGIEVDVAALDVVSDHFGDFKGLGGQELDVMTLSLDATVGPLPGSWEDVLETRGRAVLQYETGLASMAPIYYFSYWTIKYPILHKLKDRLSGPPD